MSDNNNKTLIKYQEPARPALGARDELQVQDVIIQVQKILQIKQAVMKEHEHYGVIPGTQKPTLFKAGAEKLALTFRFAPKFTITVSPLAGDHREYSCTCSLTHIHSGNLIAEGVGSCNTMEGKYRYRKADPEPVGPVPKSYWAEKNESKKSNIIGGRGFGVKKIENVWMVVRYSDQKIEHGNPADFYNTCLKMAKKRAFVDAVITATGGSDIFTQDLEDFEEHEAPTTQTPAQNAAPKNEKLPTAKTQMRGAPIQVQAHEEPPNWPEEPSEAGESPSEEVHTSYATQLEEWRSKAAEYDPKNGIKRFDGTLLAQLKARRVNTLDQLAGDAQAAVVGAMRMIVEGMITPK